MNTVSQQQKKLVSEKQPNFLGTGMSRRDFLGAGAMVTGSIVLSGKAFSMLIEPLIKSMFFPIFFVKIMPDISNEEKCGASFGFFAEFSDGRGHIFKM